MAREIKFRIWNTELETMYSSEKSEYIGFTGIVDPSCANKKGVWMQFTGLLDKNGKEVYESDLCENKAGLIGEVIFDDFAWYLKWHNGNYYPFGQEVEIVGNIFDNPELLSKGGNP